MEEISPDENRTIQVMEEKESASEEIPQASLQKESFTESSSLEIILLETPVHEDKVPRDELLELKTCEVKLSEAECLTAKPPEFGNSSETNKEFEKKVSTETPKIEEKKTPFSGREKKVRRRSSIGSVIANAFITPGTEDTMSPLEEPKRPIRPRRSVQIRQITPAPTVPRTVLQQIQPQRYSFDLGECVPIKSCLKQEKREVPIRAGTIPAQKSLTQRTANKVKNKYRKSRSFTELITPTRRRSQKLQFHRTCSIRVITPRPDYDPEAVSMPLSDDESEGLDPNRERLSTTELELTPNSQSQLAEIQNKKIVQFNAKMIFGDGDPNPTVSSAVEVVKKTESEQNSTIGPVPEAKAIEKKKRSRRKSLILGSASPLKSPAKIEQSRCEEDLEVISSETIPDPPRRSRRKSVRLIKEEVEKPEDQTEIVLHEKETSSQKKRGLVPEAVSTEPNPKRGRRKSGYISKVETDKMENEKQNGTIHSFFAPKTANEKMKKIEEKAKIQKSRLKTRRSSAYFGSAGGTTDLDSPQNSDVLIVYEAQSVPSTSSQKSDNITTETECTVIASCSSSSSVALSKSESVSMDVTRSPKPEKVAAIFSRSPAQPKKIVQIKEDNAMSTSSQSPVPESPKSTSKLFSLFSPKPKTKVESADVPMEIVISDSPITSKKESTSNPKVSIGVKRQEHWGDRHPETYEFIQRMPLQKSIFEDRSEVLNGRIFNSRSFDENILNVDNIESELREGPSSDPYLLFMEKRTNSVDIEKLPIPENSPTPAIFPTSMNNLVEGADEENEILRWLKRWKKRVRKEMENQKEKQKSSAKKGRKRKGEDDDDDEYEEENNVDLENPLVLIGPTGVGKTALTRALARQENMRIISIGPEMDRSGAEIKKQLFEALRSHRVDQQARPRVSFFYNTIKTSESTKKPKEEQKKKEFVQSLIVFEHVDVFFDTLDRYGVNSLLELINEASVPVIFTCENDWPRSIGQVELKRRFLEIRMGRNKHKVQKYVQKAVYTCRDTYIRSSTIKKLSESVNHDLQGLLHQAHLFSLAPNKPFPLTSRYLISNGFEEEWERPRNTLKNDEDNERLHEVIEMYSDVLPDCSIHPLYPNIKRTWDSDCRKLAAAQSGPSGGLQQAYEALNGRYSKRDLAVDMLPLLVPIDRVERQKKARSRRHLHQFKTYTDIKTDGDSLINVVGRWSIK